MIAYSGSTNFWAETEEDIGKFILSQHVDDTDDIVILGGDNLNDMESPQECSTIQITDCTNLDMDNLADACSVAIHMYPEEGKEESASILSDLHFALRYRDAIRGKLPGWRLYAVKIPMREDVVKLYYTDDDTFEVISLNLGKMMLKLLVPDKDPSKEPQHVTLHKYESGETCIYVSDEAWCGDRKLFIRRPEPQSKCSATKSKASLPIVRRCYDLDVINVSSIRSLLIPRKSDDAFLL